MEANTLTKKENAKYIWLSLGSTVIFAAIMLVIHVLRQNGGFTVGMIVGLTVASLVAFIAVLMPAVTGKSGISEQSVYYILFIGILLRLFYIVLTQGHYFQNDIGALQEGNLGHLGYVYYIWDNGKLPDADPMISYQFYHPPLHYLISAVFLKIFTVCGGDIAHGDEALQFLSLFYSIVLLLYLDKIAKQMKMSLTGRFVSMTFAAFLPFSVMLGGALNNDLLMITLAVMCIYYILKWYDNTDYKSIILAAICLGCAAMSKISALLLAPGIAVLMLIKAWKNFEQIKKVLLQVFCFGIISVPLGMWFPIMKHIKYDTPFGFIPAMAETSEQFIGQYSKWQRLFDFKGSFDSIVLSWSRSDTYMDHNIWTSLLKFAVTGEGYHIKANMVMEVVASVAFYMTMVWLIATVLAAVVFIIKGKTSWHIKIFYMVSIVFFMASYVSFCFRYPHICTMHIRYVMIALYMGMLMLGGMVSLADTKEKKVSSQSLKVVRRIITGAALVYAILTCLLYINLEILL